LVKQKLKKLKKFDDKLPLFFEDKLRDFNCHPKIPRSTREAQNASPIQFQVYGHKLIKSKYEGSPLLI
jgi:hypothetical protein